MFGLVGGKYKSSVDSKETTERKNTVSVDKKLHPNVTFFLRFEVASQKNVTFF